MLDAQSVDLICNSLLTIKLRTFAMPWSGSIVSYKISLIS